MKCTSSLRPQLTTEDIGKLRNALAPVLRVLDGFNYRNKNQHHASHWWSDFALLRRAVRAIVNSPYQRAEAMLLRIIWLKEHIIPKIYEPLTQCAADNQHAPLGLLLVTVLARVHAAVAAALPTEDAHPATDLVPQQAPSQPPKATVPDDKGEPVTRDAFEPHGEIHSRAKSRAVSSGVQKPQKVSKSREPRAQLVKKKKAKRDDFASMFDSI